MRRFVVYAILCSVLMLSVGCIASGGPMVGTIFTQVKGPVEVSDNAVAASKMGYSEANGILGIATGDASIHAAMSQGGLSKVHHVDVEVMNVLSIYGRVKTVVWGE